MPVSCRLKRPGVQFIDQVAADHYAGVRTDAIAGLLHLGARAWKTGQRPPAKDAT